MNDRILSQPQSNHLSLCPTTFVDVIYNVTQVQPIFDVNEVSPQSSSFFCFSVLRRPRHGVEQRLHRRGRMPDHDRRSFTRKLRHFRIQKRQKAPTGQTRATELADRFSGQSFA
jgi:hypothetical protein